MLGDFLVYCCGEAMDPRDGNLDRAKGLAVSVPHLCRRCGKLVVVRISVDEKTLASAERDARERPSDDEEPSEPTRRPTAPPHSPGG